MTETTFEVSDAPPVEFPTPDATQSKNTKSARNTKKSAPKTRPRALTDDDIDKIEKFYGVVGMGLMPVNGRASIECVNNARNCAESWAILAKDNDNVRRVLLMVIEGGAWGAVITAHMPILFAFLPGEIRDRFGFLASADDTEDSETE